MSKKTDEKPKTAYQNRHNGRLNHKLNKPEDMIREFRLIRRAIERTKDNPKEKYFHVQSVEVAKGKIIEGKEWTLHPANILTKLAKATNNTDVITSGNIEELLNAPFMAQVEVKEKDSGKTNDAGEPIIYRNVNYKGCSEVPLDDDDQPMQVAELNTEAKCITFQNAKVEDIKFIRKKGLEIHA